MFRTRLLNPESWTGFVQIYVERVSGCSHMVCRMCASEFCYFCGQSWNSHPRNCRTLSTNNDNPMLSTERRSRTPALSTNNDNPMLFNEAFQNVYLDHDNPMLLTERRSRTSISTNNDNPMLSTERRSRTPALSTNNDNPMLQGLLSPHEWWMHSPLPFLP